MNINFKNLNRINLFSVRTLWILLIPIVVLSLNSCMNPFEPEGVGQDICYHKLFYHWQIVLNSKEGGEVKNISNNPDGAAYSPAWAPDGKYIAFRYDRPVGGTDIYLYDLEGDSLINLTSDIGVSTDSPMWTPDGEKILFAYHEMGEPNYTYIMNKDGSNKKKLLDFFTNRYIFFYPDAHHFIYMRDSCVYKTDIDRTSDELLVNLSEIGEYNVWMDDFNPYKEEILYHEDTTSWGAGYSFILETYNINTGDIDTVSIADSNWIFLRPKYSSDYSKIAVIEKDFSRGIYKIVILEDGEKEELVRLTGEDEWVDFHPLAFSPKDTYLAYSKNINQGGQMVWWKSYLHVVNLVTKRIRFIDEGVNPKWNPMLPF
jgi:dipeptidyl aminopeptidase/acylaminoacyl peptidase